MLLIIIIIIIIIIIVVVVGVIRKVYCSECYHAQSTRRSGKLLEEAS